MMFALREPHKVFVSQFASPIGTLWLAATQRGGLVKLAFDGGEEDHGLEWVLKRFPMSSLFRERRITLSSTSSSMSTSRGET